MRELVDKQLMLEDVKSWIAMDSYDQHWINNMSAWIENLPTVEVSDEDCISRRVAIDAIGALADLIFKNVEKGATYPKRQWFDGMANAESIIKDLPSVLHPEIIRCEDCKHWIRQTNYQGAPLSFGFCESEDMWASLYGETTGVEHIDTDDNHYCGYAERRTDE